MSARWCYTKYGFFFNWSNAKNETSVETPSLGFFNFFGYCNIKNILVIREYDDATPFQLRNNGYQIYPILIGWLVFMLFSASILSENSNFSSSIRPFIFVSSNLSWGQSKTLLNLWSSRFISFPLTFPLKLWCRSLSFGLSSRATPRGNGHGFPSAAQIPIPTCSIYFPGAQEANEVPPRRWDTERLSRRSRRPPPARRPCTRPARARRRCGRTLTSHSRRTCDCKPVLPLPRWGGRRWFRGDQDKTRHLRVEFGGGKALTLIK